MVLITGDSLSAGNIGIGFSQFLPEGDYLIRGIDGDTMLGVTSRTTRYLKQKRVRENVCGIIIECGNNDVLLPYLLQSRNDLFIEAAGSLIHEQTPPLDTADEFASVYASQLQTIISMAGDIGLTPEDIAITSLPPLGENLHAPIESYRKLYNDEIRKIAKRIGVSLIDLDTTMTAAYEAFQPVDAGIYFMDEPSNFVKDAAYIKADHERARELTLKRGLNLTVDGLHYNAAGAEAAAQAFIPFLNSIA